MNTAASAQRRTAQGLWWLTLSVGMGLPVMWGLALPRFLLLDALALDIAQSSGLLAGVTAALTGAGIAAFRLRRGPYPLFPYRATMDLALLSATAAIACWAINRVDPRMPYIESFSILGLQVALGGASSLLLNALTRRQLRRGALRPRRRSLPGLRGFFTLNAAFIGFLAAVSLGLGSLGRAAGGLDLSRAARLSEHSTLLATALQHTKTPERIDALLALFSSEPGIKAQLLPTGARPTVLTQASHVSRADHRYLLIDGPRRLHLIARTVSPSQTLWIWAPANVRPPVQAPDDAPTMLILTLLVLGAPLAAFLVGDDLRWELRQATATLRAMGPTVPPAAIPRGVATASNDEAGDLALALDATVRVHIEEGARLQEALNAADDDDRARGQLLAATSHDLRTPLTTILGYCHLLGHDGALNAAQTEDLGLIKGAGEALLGHINEILSISQLDGEDALPLQLEPLRLTDIATEQLDKVRRRAPTTLTLSIQTMGEPALVRADGRRIAQVVRNLLENALKFTASGEIVVTVTPHQLGERPAVKLSVRDTGPGIPADELDTIFRAFHRLRGHRDVAGTGLGLVIARRIAEQHGGTLSVESTIGEGSTFSLVLPV